MNEVQVFHNVQTCTENTIVKINKFAEGNQ